MTPTDTTTEKDVAEALGLSTRHLSEIRKKNAAALPEGEAWQRDGQRIHWTTPGIAALTALLSLEKKEGAPEPAAPLPDLVAVVVDRIVPNPRYLLVRKKNAAGVGEGDLLRLRVNSNRNFLPGMIVERCRPVPGSPDLYEHEGRCPRWRGRW